MLPELFSALTGRQGHSDGVPVITNVLSGTVSTEASRIGVGQVVQPDIDPTEPDTVPEHLDGQNGGDAAPAIPSLLRG